MSQPAHAERAHALLGASKASQWINCPPSARLQESVPDKRSEYADEGTAAHELSELILRRTLTPCNAAERLRLDKAIADFKAGNQYYSPEMESAVSEYVDVVTERFFAAKARSSDAVILLEDRLDFTEWVPDGYGTGDVVIIADEVMEIIDLKYGKGVPVSAIGNPQLRLYGLGAWWNWNYLYSIREVSLTIVQPRLDSVSTDTLLLGELIQWAETVVKPAAALADAGEGDFKSGDHCRWCKVKGNCRARADENMKALAYEFQDPALLSLEEVGSVLFVAEQLKVWAKDVEDYAFDQAKNGTKIPAWKLVEGRSNRVITNKEALKVKLIEAGFEESKLLKPQELLGIGDLETKVVGSKKEFAALVGDLVIKPQGKPVLVPETDKRPELNSVENDFANENFEEAN
ncbi:PD-(D/E)XK nuclease superfamily protein [compost metagenome]